MSADARPVLGYFQNAMKDGHVRSAAERTTVGISGQSAQFSRASKKQGGDDTLNCANVNIVEACDEERSDKAVHEHMSHRHIRSG